MEVKGFEEILADHPVFRDFDADILLLLAGCCMNEHFKPGEVIYGEGDGADKVYILRHGDVAIEVGAPGRGQIIVETLHAGDILGWSWIVPPYRHRSEAHATSEVRAVSIDAACLRRKCDDNPVLGYRIFQHWLPHMAQRVQVLRMQLLDLYGTRG
ncbi:cyclic nucleotide-binding domain-containing protein [Acidimangrovimonas pyrenivorans]|uniref:Cyclic nucleotide-binding domain-containing protein n=1 Tax=Acidimangrovimonas pyrenivorans TaxID=2030798 RepID=A0ABV7AF82_9RHOB